MDQIRGDLGRLDEYLALCTIDWSLNRDDRKSRHDDEQKGNYKIQKPSLQDPNEVGQIETLTLILIKSGLLGTIGLKHRRYLLQN